MNNYDTESHDSGGLNSPYQKQHFTESEFQNTKYVSYDNDGIAFPEMLEFFTWEAVPATSTSSGVRGQKARDEDYLYICVEDNHWKRTPVESTF